MDKPDIFEENEREFDGPGDCEGLDLMKRIPSQLFMLEVFGIGNMMIMRLFAFSSNRAQILNYGSTACWDK